jgi:hypothetical protein
VATGNAVPDVVPGGSSEPAVPVVKDPRMDVVRRRQRCDHLLPQHLRAAAPGVPQKRGGDGHRKPWCDHLYVCGLGRERSDGDHSELLHLDTARVHLGWHHAMARVPGGLRCHHSDFVDELLHHGAGGGAASYWVQWSPCWCPPPRSSPSLPTP